MVCRKLGSSSYKHTSKNVIRKHSSKKLREKTIRSERSCNRMTKFWLSICCHICLLEHVSSSSLNALIYNVWTSLMILKICYGTWTLSFNAWITIKLSPSIIVLLNPTWTTTVTLSLKALAFATKFDVSP